MADVDLPDLTAKIRLDTSELEGAVKKASGIGSAIGSAVGNLAAGGISSAVSGITTFAQGSVDAFAQLEDATAAAGVLFGDSMSVITERSKTAASEAGISAQQFIDAATTFGTFGQAAGLSGKGLTDFSGNLTQLSADMASFKGTTPEQAIEAVGAALRGESEPIRAYGVLLDEATINQEAQRIGLVKAQVDHTKTRSAVAALALAREKANKVEHDSKATDAERLSARAAVGRAEKAYQTALAGSVPALTKQQKLLATQSAIINQTKNATGDFARTADSTANTQKRLAAETANAQAELGARLAPALTALRVILLGLITNLSSMLDFISQNIDVIVIITSVVAIATVALTAHSIAVRTVSAVTRAWTAVQAALNFVMSANPIGLIIIAIAALVAGIVIAYRRSETFRNIVQTTWAVIKVVVSAVIGWLTTAVPAAFQWIKNAFLRYTVVGIVISHWTQIMNFIRSAIDRIRAIISWFGQLPSLIGGWFGRAYTAATGKLGDLVGFIKGIPGKILSALGNMGNLLLGIGGDIVQGLVNGLRNSVSRVADAARELVSHIPEPIRKFLHIGSPSRLMRDIGQDTGAGLELGLLDSVPSIASAAGRMVGAALPSTELQLGARVTGANVGGSQLVELSPAALGALASALPDVLVQVLLDSEPIAAVVDKRLGAAAAGYTRAGG
jgi:hypothetical protein